MTYAAALQFLYGLQLFGTNFGLENTRRLAALAGDPQNRLRFIHVAGTNGKGSTCAMLDSIYRAAGLRVALYTSPHLVSFRERIQINRELIPEADVARLVHEAQPWLAQFSPENHPTFFEVVTVIALRWFAEQRCDLVIWETGLGGRLDATNIVTPLVSVITNIQFDHEKWLGSTLEEIAREKAGIIKPAVPVISGVEAGPAGEVIRDAARLLHASLHLLSQPETARVVGLRGEHQQMNAALAVKTVEVLAATFAVTDGAKRAGLASVEWPARFQVIRRGTQTIVLDGAHNPDGARAFARTWRAEFPNQPATLILGLLEDKNGESVCRTLGTLAGKIVVTPVSSKRTASADRLAAFCRTANPAASTVVAKSLAEAFQTTAHDPLLAVTGSLYLVGEALELLGLAGAAGERGLNEWAARPKPSR